MIGVSREFQVFVKPAGPACNLACDYCYYLAKQGLYPHASAPRMHNDLLEAYIIQHIEAHPGPVINFSWHGGEPTLLGPDFFRKAVALQHRHRPPACRITNGIQTNGTLLNKGWYRFLAEAGFGVGLSLDGPSERHDRHRVFRDRRPTHARVMRAFDDLQRHRIPIDILCVVHSQNVRHPMEVYNFFKQIGANCLTFLPLVERRPGATVSVTSHSVAPEDWGDFLCRIFDEWIEKDIGRVEIQIFDEVAAAACGREHALCIFRPTCGDIPVIEHNGDFYPCDHFVDADHRLGNIRRTRLTDLIESPALRAFGQSKWDSLPRFCLDCEALQMCNGGCPKDRFLKTPDGQNGLNYLCAGYKRFFNHCMPFFTHLSALSRLSPALQQRSSTPVEQAESHPKPGRNAPCPCGSGRKYKKCCLGK